MKLSIKWSILISISFISIFIFSFGEKNNSQRKNEFPYTSARLTERQAAAHLISRFTFGAKPGEVDAVVKMGLEKWFMQQLNGNLLDDDVKNRLDEYDGLELSNAEVIAKYPRPGEILKMAVKDGYIKKDTVDIADQAAYRKKLAPYALQKGFKPQRELFRQFASQKIIRALYSNNQLHEMLTEFWFNHFNVSITKHDCAEFIPSYERDVIRPNVAGKFSTLLLATAKSPAMLMYLDNFSSAGTNNDLSKDNSVIKKRMKERMLTQFGDSTSELMEKIKKVRKSQGLNENYAREVMELHTLGVDGGYTQQDVTEASKVLTGWTIYPMGDNALSKGIKKVIERIGEDRISEKGFVHDGDFLFATNRHDVSKKTVLGTSFSKDGGYQEGVQLLNMLAHHPSTAKFICRKLAIRFVNDNPPSSLIDKLVKTFDTKDGDIKQVLITMVSSPEFWSKEAVREKTKSPFELAISSLRSLQADVEMPYQIYSWIEKMGQKIYYYQAPTGFPDKGQYWINSGSLLNRMNFGLALANNKIPGVKFNLLCLNNGHEPENTEDALIKYGKLLMPERDLAQTIKRLTPMLNDPQLKKRIEDAAGSQASSNSDNMQMDNEQMGEEPPVRNKQKNNKTKLDKENEAGIANAEMENYMLSQVVGIIIGSPEFQRK